MAQVIKDTRRATIGLVLVIAVCLSIETSAFFMSSALGYLLVLITVGWGGAFFLDFTLAWTGCYNRWRLPVVMILLSSSIICLSTLFGINSDDISLGVTAAFLYWAAIGFAVFFETTVFPVSPAVYLLRNTVGLRSSGDPQMGSIACRMTGKFASTYGEKVVRMQIEGIIFSLLRSGGRLAYDEKTLASSNLKTIQNNEIIVLYGLNNDFLETLVIPIDGIVARFEKSIEYLPAFHFLFYRLLGCSPTTGAEQADSNARMSGAFDQLSKRSRTRLVAAVFSGAGVVCAFVLYAIYTNSTDIWAALTDEVTSRGLVSIAAVGTIILGVFGAVAWVLRLTRRERN